ncbi:MAG TPA: anti-sigma factor [Acidimicrobiales bacterium]|jgi:anti-sigma factor RsiW|nr:anti-sigma factor [Acidimicrobiales bacterium]
MTHEELQELLGAYAVDAVEPDEVALIDAHIAECPRCRAEVTELREVAALLSHSGADAPDGVWERIASSLDEVPPPLRLEVQRERRGRRGRMLRAGAFAVAAAAIVVLGIGVIRLRSEVDDLKHPGGTDLALAAEQAMTAPDARIARLSGEGGRSAVAVVRSNGQGFFLGSALPALDQRIYQLWGATSSGKITSLGTVPGPGVYAFAADPSITVVMVTEERAPVAAPTSSAIVTGTLA